jgi:uncharacterized protein (TIGR02284 family)
VSKENRANVLSDLAATCRDAQEGYLKAAKGAHDTELSIALARYASQREAFADELNERAAALGGKPAQIGHAGSVLHHGWVDLEQQPRPQDDASILAGCQRGEDDTVKHYQRALGVDLPPEISELVRRQLEAIQGAIQKLRGLERVKRAG